MLIGNKKKMLFCYLYLQSYASLKRISKALIGCLAVHGAMSLNVFQVIGWLQLLLVVGGALL